jgi:sugar/nucleoside kinase (ribokinase family)
MESDPHFSIQGTCELNNPSGSTEPVFDILVAGEINPDLILTGDVIPEFGQIEKLVDSFSLTIGSSAAIFSCGAARLGLRTAFAGVCARDVFGSFMLDEMQKRSVDVRGVLLKDGQTGLSVILSTGSDRAILTFAGLIPALRAEDIPDSLLGQVRHLHVASYFLQTTLQPGLPDLFRRARNLGITTSLDTNYDPTGLWAGFDDLLALTNVFLPNEKEAISLSRQPDVESAAQLLGKQAEVVVVKLGSRGALGVREGHMVHSPSFPVQVIDTVGAGDSFNAGFLHGYLSGWDLEKSLSLACGCGALSTRKAGGTEAQPTLEEVVAYVS